MAGSKTVRNDAIRMQTVDKERLVFFQLAFEMSADIVFDHIDKLIRVIPKS